MQGGGGSWYVYTRLAGPVTRIELSASEEQIYRSGQSAPVDFGTVEEFPAQMQLLVRNIGNTALTGLNASFEGIHTQDFSAILGSTELTPGATTSLNVEFLGAIGARSTLTVSATENASLFHIPVTGSVGAPAGFAVVPAGTFTMGRTSGDTDSNAQPVNVIVSGFAIQTTEVTRDQWNEVRSWGLANGYTDIETGGGKAGNHPVNLLNWWSAVKWCNARSEKDGLDPVYRNADGTVFKIGRTAPTPNWSANGYRLPTEAEWEKAARGGVSGQRFPWGETIRHAIANFRNNGGESYQSGTTDYHPTYATGSSPFTSPVGSFAPNGFGLYDMAGNVFEWTWDWYGASYYAEGAVDPWGPGSGTYRVLRGGSFRDSAYFARSSIRITGTPGFTYTGGGFRPARGRP